MRPVRGSGDRSTKPSVGIRKESAPAARDWVLGRGEFRDSRAGRQAIRERAWSSHGDSRGPWRGGGDARGQDSRGFRPTSKRGFHGTRKPVRSHRGRWDGLRGRPGDLTLRGRNRIVERPGTQRFTRMVSMGMGSGHLRLGGLVRLPSVVPMADQVTLVSVPTMMGTPSREPLRALRISSWSGRAMGGCDRVNRAAGPGSARSGPSFHPADATGYSRGTAAKHAIPTRKPIPAPRSAPRRCPMASPPMARIRAIPVDLAARRNWRSFMELGGWGSVAGSEPRPSGFEF